MLMRATTILNLILALTISSSGQARPANLKPGSPEAKALAFFERIEDRRFDDFLNRIRLPRVSEAHMVDVLERIPESEVVGASDRMKGKLAALESILRYHQREYSMGIRVIRAHEAFVRVQGRAVLLISEPALNLLPVSELQAVVAHELGHEYFWAEYFEARQQRKHELIREIELRCDGIAVITLLRLGLNPAKLVSALDRIRSFNARIVPIDPLYHPQPDRRSRFIRAMIEMVIRSQSPATALTQRNCVECFA